MSELVFVDTNILIYAHDRDAGERRARAIAALEPLWRERTGRLSVQVLQEFFVVATATLREPMQRAAAREIVRTYGTWVTAPADVDGVLRAAEIAELAAVSFWDAMIIAAAERCGAGRLLSEDLQEGQIIAGVRVVNPLR